MTERRPPSRLSRLARDTFWMPVDQPAGQPPAAVARARVVAAVTLVVGALVLWLTLRIAPGDVLFYPATLGLAAIWAIGGMAGARPRMGWVRTRSGGKVRPVLEPLLIGLALVALFVVGALVVARVPFLRGPVDELLDHAKFGSLGVVLVMTMINGVAEELFFRGTLYDAMPPGWRIGGTVVLYAAVTAASGVPLLVLAGVLLGIVTALQRRVSGGILAPIITHITWSASMLLLLPPLLDAFG